MKRTVQYKSNDIPVVSLAKDSQHNFPGYWAFESEYGKVEITPRFSENRSGGQARIVGYLAQYPASYGTRDGQSYRVNSDTLVGIREHITFVMASLAEKGVKHWVTIK